MSDDRWRAVELSTAIRDGYSKACTRGGGKGSVLRPRMIRKLGIAVKVLKNKTKKQGSRSNPNAKIKTKRALDSVGLLCILRPRNTYLCIIRRDASSVRNSHVLGGYQSRKSGFIYRHTHIHTHTPFDGKVPYFAYSSQSGHQHDLLIYIQQGCLFVCLLVCSPQKEHQRDMHASQSMSTAYAVLVRHIYGNSCNTSCSNAVKSRVWDKFGGY